MQKTGVASFVSRTAQSMTIKIGEETLEYDLICVNEFSSERKLMSVVVRDRATDKLFVYVKGAGSMINQRLSEDSKNGALRAKIDAEVDRFGAKGLRTLVFAMREMSESEFA